MIDAILGIGTGVIGLAAIIVIAMLAFKLETAYEARAAADARSSSSDAKLAIATATVATERNRADDEKRRADALDDALAATWSDPDPGTARERVLARWQMSRATPGAAAGTNPGPVHAAQDAQTVPAVHDDRDELLKPGE